MNKSKPKSYISSVPVRDRISAPQPLGLDTISLSYNELPFKPTRKIAKAIEDAKKNLVRIPILGATLPHEQKGKFGGAKVFLKPASHGTGVIAGGAVRHVLESVGIHDVLSKSQGSSNPHNVVKATFNALLQLRSAASIAEQRGISLEKVFNG